MQLHVIIIITCKAVVKMKKQTPKEIIDKLKSQRKPERSNYTYRLPTKLMENLERVCKQNDIKITAVLEELIGEFVRNDG